MRHRHGFGWVLVCRRSSASSPRTAPVDPSGASAAPRRSEPRQCRPGRVAARLPTRRRRWNSPQEPVGLRRAAPHPAAPGMIPWPDRPVAPHGHGRSTGRSAAARRAARPVDGTIINEADHGFEQRSSSVVAKYAAAWRRISFA